MKIAVDTVRWATTKIKIMTINSSRATVFLAFASSFLIQSPRVLAQTIVPPPDLPLLHLSPELKQAYESASINWQVTASSAQAVAETPACIAATIGQVPCEEAMAAIILTANAAALTCDVMARDPPDFNYSVLAQLVIPSLPRDSPPGELGTLIANLTEQIGTARAMLTSINREQGATLSGNRLWAILQRQAASRYALQLAALSQQQGDLLTRFQVENENSVFQITSSELTKAQQLIAMNGLGANTVADLEGLGFTSDDLAALRLALSSATLPSAIQRLVGIPVDPALKSHLADIVRGLTQFVGLAEVNPRDPQLDVDFGAPLGVKSASGFLHGIGATTPDTLVQPLKPALWRFAAFPPYNSPLPYLARIAPFLVQGGTPQLVPSDLWGYPVSGMSKAPYDDWPAYEALVRTTARQMGLSVTYDVWNEPNLGGIFWFGTKEQFFETYLRAYRIIRQELGPDAVIGGPSLSSSYNKAYITDFANFCVQNGCEVNFLSWHELRDDDDSIAAITDHLIDARQSFLKNPSYASLRTKAIYINEIVGRTSAHNPAAILAHFAYLEQGDADGAAKACWLDSAGVSECANATLDGVLTANLLPQARAAWWAYKLYADGVDGRVLTESTDRRVVALASNTSEHPSSNNSNHPFTAQILVGYNNTNFDPSFIKPASITLNLTGIDKHKFLPGHEELSALVERIPAAGESAVPALDFVGVFPIDVSTGMGSLVLPPLNTGEVYKVTLVED